MIEINERQKELIEKQTIALATADLSGIPNVIAVACCRVVAKDKILVTDNYMSKTKGNLLANNRIALAVWSEGGEAGYQFRGQAEYITSGRWKEMVDEDPNNKGLAHKAAVLVTVDEIWDLAEPKLIAKR